MPEPTETPATPTSETSQQVAQHVEQAQQGASSVASETGESVWKSIADELKGLRNDIGKILNTAVGSTPEAETKEAPAAVPAAATVPGVTVETPAKQEYHVRRNGRKVRRER